MYTLGEKKKCRFFGKCCVRTEWMINYLSVQINFYSKEQCALPAKVRRELEFRFFGEGQNIFDLRRGGGSVF